jgi:hypothetical protein
MDPLMISQLIVDGIGNTENHLLQLAVDDIGNTENHLLQLAVDVFERFAQIQTLLTQLLQRI